MKVGRLILTAVLRIKCNLNCNGVLSRILMGLSESVLLFSLPSYTLDLFLQTLATLRAAAGLFLAQLSRFPTSHLLWCLLKGKNRSASSIACFTCSEAPQSLGFTPYATGQCSPLGDVALGCSGHFLPRLPVGRKPSLIQASSASAGKSLFLCMSQAGNPWSEPLDARGAVQEGAKQGKASALNHWTCPQPF